MQRVKAYLPRVNGDHRVDKELLDVDPGVRTPLEKNTAPKSPQGSFFPVREGPGEPSVLEVMHLNGVVSEIAEQLVLTHQGCLRVVVFDEERIPVQATRDAQHEIASASGGLRAANSRTAAGRSNSPVLPHRIKRPPRPNR
jgi:hypothetical protein